MKTYLGDSVYAEIENGMIKLTTENGFGPSNTIFLEPEVLSRLNLFLRESMSAKPTESQASAIMNRNDDDCLRDPDDDDETGGLMF